MLRENELAFSKILESLSIDSGHLNYHLESLGDLITRSKDGKYRLSSFGLAAVKLMSGVEEHDSSTAPPKRKSIVNLTGRDFLSCSSHCLASNQRLHVRIYNADVW